MGRLIFGSRGGVAAVLFVALLWLGCSDDGSGPTAPDDPQPNISVVDQAVFAHVITVQERHTQELLSVPGVVGTAVGLAANGEPSVKVYVTEDGVADVPSRIEGVRFVVEVTGEIFALQGGPPDRCPPTCADPTARFDRPVPIGVSTGHPNITAGTIGARVTDGSDVYALSNNHVYADENLATIGDNVLQPGVIDGGLNPGDAIGILSDFVSIVFGGGDNTIDAAIAMSTVTLLGNATPFDGYGTPRSTTIVAAVGQSVIKYGRTTGQTSGRIDAINATVDVGYSSGVARFVGQIIIRPGNFSRGGDSGSLIVVEEGPDALKPVGLLFAGGRGVTVANPIDAVLSAFGVTIDGPP